MLHPAILFGGFFMIAAGVTGYTIFQVLQEQEFCQEDYPDMFRYSHDFDFHDMNEKQEVFTSDRYDLVQENTTLRNRKLPQETQETAEQELKQLEESLTERKRRLLAEQAFLDREEEQLRQRQNELMQNEQQLNHVTDSQANTPSVAAIENPFFDNHDTSSSEDDDDDDDDVNDSHNTILVHETTVDTPNHDEVASTYSTSILDLSNHSLSDSIQSPRLIASSDSEESWDAMSAGELNELNSRRESTHWDE
ncbi:uncharacterized protein B0P05DRAFT_636157 [Gilbertella persicaria]|uniref:uncharacterized protein n=1 Tax=Gilbertella persicaria TaxID=101096 RepID=UPI0022200A14|nr:uncharacterized protein B0P05DRAFT_636157 [Gilbertella persicaria]KAI8083973.1 hypothetical protein B0P05DRAFT_636157 [Gilbertella persicaria]